MSLEIDKKHFDQINFERMKHKAENAKLKKAIKETILELKAIQVFLISATPAEHFEQGCAESTAHDFLKQEEKKLKKTLK